MLRRLWYPLLLVLTILTQTVLLANVFPSLRSGLSSSILPYR